MPDRARPVTRSLRFRITLAFGLSGALLAFALATTTFLTVRSFLERQRIAASAEGTFNTIITAQTFFQQDAQAEIEPLIALLQRRPDQQAMVVTKDDYFSTTFSFTPSIIPAGLKDIVSREQVGYQFTTVEGTRVLTFGAPLPPANTDLYVIYGLEDIDQTLSVLLRVLAVACVLMGIAGVAIAQRVGARMMRPLEELSTATRRVAEGLLETRVTADTADEMGVLAASFNEMTGAMQRMLERERRFVADVSHELRTPLSTLRSASETLASHRDDLTGSGREAADLIIEDVENLDRLLRELMEMSEVDAGRAVPRREQVDLLALTNATVAKLRRVVTVTGSPTVAFTDKARVGRILTNLIENAFTHGGGAVTVHVNGQPDAAVIHVTDEGPGISPEELPHLFDRFFKTDKSRSRDRGGVGLGLAISSETARLLGGTLQAESVQGEGATFILRLPVEREDP